MTTPTLQSTEDRSQTGLVYLSPSVLYSVLAVAITMEPIVMTAASGSSACYFLLDTLPYVISYVDTAAVMAGASGAESMLEAELSCPVCLDTYRDPVWLGCGHCFCKACISETLRHQNAQGRAYTCPMCQAQYNGLPTLTKNLQLSSLVDNYMSVQKSPEACQIPCDDCLDHPRTAVKTCVSCEVALCPKHVERHKIRGHVLLEPTASVQDRKCPDHDKLLEYVCQQDGNIICVTCYIAGSHRGHSVMTMKEAREKRQATLSATTFALSAGVTTFCKDINNLKAGLEKITENTERLSKPLENLRDQIIMQVKDQFKEISHEILTNQVQTASKITALIKQMEEAKETMEVACKKLRLISNQTDDLLFVKDFNSLQVLINQKSPQIDTMRVIDVEADKTMIANVEQETADYVASIRGHLACMQDVLSQQIEQFVWPKETKARQPQKRVKVPNQKKVLPTKGRKSDKMNLQFGGQNYQHCSYTVTVSGQFRTLSAAKLNTQTAFNLYSPYDTTISKCGCRFPVVIPNCIASDRSSGRVHCLVDVSRSNGWCVGVSNSSRTEQYLRWRDNFLSYESNVSLSLGKVKINTLKMQLDFDNKLLGFYDAGHETEIPILICKLVYLPTNVGFNICEGSLSLI